MKMILKIREDLKIHLSLLFGQPLNVLQDFCTLALEFISRDLNPKVYITAAQKLEVEPQNIEDAVGGIVFLLVESCRLKLNELDFRDSILTIGFDEEQQALLSDLYRNKQKELTDVIQSSTFNIPHFKDLEWRFETQVSSRCLLNQLVPQVTIKLTLDNGENDERILLQSDPKNLQRLTESLEEALSEATSQNSRKILKKIKF